MRTHTTFKLMGAVLVALATPAIPVLANEGATGQTTAEFKVTGKRPSLPSTHNKPGKHEALPARHKSIDQLPGTMNPEQRKLPQTSDVSGAWLSLAGIVMLVGLTWQLRRKEGAND